MSLLELSSIYLYVPNPSITKTNGSLPLGIFFDVKQFEYLSCIITPMVFQFDCKTNRKIR